MKTQVKITQRTKWEMPAIVGTAILLLCVVSIGFNFLFESDSYANEQSEHIKITGQIEFNIPPENGFGKMDLYLDLNQNGYWDLTDSLLESTHIQNDGSYHFDFYYSQYKQWKDTLYLQSAEDDYEIVGNGSEDFYSDDLDLNENVVVFRFLSKYNAATRIKHAQLMLNAAELEEGYAAVKINQIWLGSGLQKMAMQMETPLSEIGPWKMEENYVIPTFCPLSFEDSLENGSQIVLRVTPSKGVDDRDATAFEKNPLATQLHLSLEKGLKTNHLLLIPRQRKIKSVSKEAIKIMGKNQSFERDFYWEYDAPEIQKLKLTKSDKQPVVQWQCNLGGYEGTDVQLNYSFLSLEEDELVFSDSGSAEDFETKMGMFEISHPMLSTHNQIEVHVSLKLPEKNRTLANQVLAINQNLEIVNQFKAYPIPFDEELTMNADVNKSVQIQIFNLTGELVYNTNLDRGISKETIATGGWSSGVYAIKILGTNKSYKIIKN